MPNSAAAAAQRAAAIDDYRSLDAQIAQLHARARKEKHLRADWGALKIIGGHAVRSVGSGTLIACLAESIASDDVEQLALGMADWHGELEPAGDTTVVFHDSSYPSRPIINHLV